MKQSTRSFYTEVVERAVTTIAQSLDEALDLAVLARAATLAPLHFHQIFRGMVGETPLTLHRRLRLERAAHALLVSEVPVTTIAFAAGYETHESFTRAFRAAFGSAPSQFRDEARRARGACEPPRAILLGATCGVHFGDTPPFSLALYGGIAMQVDIQSVAAMRLAAVSHRGPYMQIGEAFGRLGALMPGPFPDGTQMVALYHDDPEAVAPEDLRSDAALTIPEGAPLPAGTHELRLAAGTYACHRHRGPYSELPDVWARLLGQWLPQSGHELAKDGTSFELYRNTPMDAAPEDLVTEIYVPLVAGA